MIAVFTFLTVLVLSLIIVRVATVALTLTGLSKEMARFQARSAWTGTGYTTAESERVVDHPVRRRVVSILMVLRSAGLITAVTSLFLSFAGARAGDVEMERAMIILVSVLALWLVSMSHWVDRRLSRLIRRLLIRYTDLDARDYGQLLHLTGDYTVVELEVEDAESWLAGRRLSELRLSDEGVLVLGVEKSSGAYIGAPRGETELAAGDVVLVYGTRARIRELRERERDLSGQAAHYSAVREQSEREAEENQQAGAAEAATYEPGQANRDERP
jgi:hypothetical protein